MILFNPNSTAEFKDAVLKEYDKWNASYVRISPMVIIQIAEDCKAVVHTDKNGNHVFTYVGI